MLKSEGTYGSLTRVVTSRVLIRHYEYVSNASTDLNAPNGVYKMKDSVSGVV